MLTITDNVGMHFNYYDMLILRNKKESRDRLLIRNEVENMRRDELIKSQKKYLE